MEKERLELTMKLMGEIASEAGANVETKRITDNIDLFEAMVRDAYDNVQVVVGGHHILALCTGWKLPLEIASADTLIFDHRVAQRVWGGHYKKVLVMLAEEPQETRDALLRTLYAGRP